MQFKLTDLMRLIAYCAVGAWLYSFGIELGLLVWMGTVFGIEIGRRSAYPTALKAMCGAVLGLLVWMGIFFTGSEFSARQVFVFFNITVFQFLLGIVWLTALGTFLWMITRLKNRPAKQAP